MTLNPTEADKLLKRVDDAVGGQPEQTAHNNTTGVRSEEGAQEMTAAAARIALQQLGLGASKTDDKPLTKSPTSLPLPETPAPPIATTKIVAGTLPTR